MRGTGAFCDAYAMRGTCPQEGATHFSGHIYISACAGISISMVLASVGLASLTPIRPSNRGVLSVRIPAVQQTGLGSLCLGER